MTIRDKILTKIEEGKKLINKHVVTYLDKDGNSKEHVKYGGDHNKAIDDARKKNSDLQSVKNVITSQVEKK